MNQPTDKLCSICASWISPDCLTEYEGKPAHEVCKKMRTEPLRPTFGKAIETAINSYSKENGSNTPDFILAEYLLACLSAFDGAANARAEWYGRTDAPGQSAPSAERAQVEFRTADLPRKEPKIVYDGREVEAPSSERATNDELLRRLERIEKDFTPGAWELYTSNSWRRIGLKFDYRTIIEPVKLNDGHPDLTAKNPEDVKGLIALRNALPEIIAALSATSPTIGQLRSALAHTLSFDEHDPTCPECMDARELLRKAEGTGA
jgi:hypothetical protein